jgi:hypothetical protein
MPGNLIPDDLGRMIPAGADPLAYARQYLRASEGPLVLVRGQPLRVGTLVPATRDGGTACIHFKGGLCAIHEVAPFGCAYFHCRMTQHEGDVLSRKGLIRIMEAHQNRDLYGRLWTALWEEGLRTSSLAERRTALTAAASRRLRATLSRPRRMHKR